MGKTIAPQWLNNSDQILDIVLEFIDKIIPKQEFLIASESYGCYLARGVLLKKFSQIEGILFICPLIIPLPEKRDLPKKIEVIKKDPEFISSLNPLDTQEIEEALVIQNRDIWERYREEVFSGLNIVDQDFMNRVFPDNYECLENH
jgi:hypothetical protein